ncbi:hypothetical protein [Stieleria varia]|uniref:Uncharacterized protein n=1 Tax=Stieleria varia TaxID=2528005 RepID=A0A5C6AT26_9BACT|nr:hypothetical protein [Stieleria varia]TWU02708.1 hypothetical protein Pla52n_37670 [Stieleria varia]
MNDFDKFAYFLRSPEYPFIVDVDGILIAARSGKPLCGKLLRVDLVDGQSYEAIDKTGAPWSLIMVKRTAVLSPFNLRNQPTKLELIRWFNGRENKPADEVDYSEKSLSSKSRDRILSEIVDRLLDAEKRNASRRA